MLRAIRIDSPSHRCLDVSRPPIDQRDILRDFRAHDRGAARGAPDLQLGRSESAGTESYEQLQRTFHEINGLRFAKARLPVTLAAGLVPLQTVGSHGQRRVERSLPATGRRRGAASRPGPNRSPGAPSPRQRRRSKGQGRTPRLSLGLPRYRPAESPQCKADRLDRSGASESDGTEHPAGTSRHSPNRASSLQSCSENSKRSANCRAGTTGA